MNKKQAIGYLRSKYTKELEIQKRALETIRNVARHSQDFEFHIMEAAKELVSNTRNFKLFSKEMQEVLSFFTHLAVTEFALSMLSEYEQAEAATSNN